MILPPAVAPGRLISRHGRSGLHGVVLAVAIVFLLAALALPLPLLGDTPVDPQARPLIVGTCIGMLLIGLVLLLVWQRIGPVTVLELHEHGIIVRKARTRTAHFVPFVAMSDLYLYRTGRSMGGLVNALAFRRDIEDGWVDVLENRGDSFRLRGAIIEGQLRERGPLALRTLERDEPVTFHFIPDTGRPTRRTVGDLPDAPAQSLVLSTAGVEIGEGLLPLSEIASVDEGNASGHLRLLDARGDVLWSVRYLSLFSADLFIVLMRTLIEARQYGIGTPGSAG